eukprot:jgi/Ulvmu1/2526/UM138_0031.1
MPGSANTLCLYQATSAAGEPCLMASVKENGEQCIIDESVTARCEALQLLFSNMCDSASAGEAELIGVDADSFIFWASTLPNDAMPFQARDDMPIASAEQVLSALQVSEFLGDELCDEWALAAAQHVLAHYARVVRTLSGRLISADILWASFPHEHLHYLSPRCQDLVLTHIPFCIGLSLPSSLHSCLMHIHSSPFPGKTSPATLTGMPEGEGLHVDAPIPPDLPFNHANILPVLSNLLCSSVPPVRALSISAVDSRMPASFPEPPQPPHPLSTPDFPTLLLHFSPYLSALPLLRHFSCDMPILKTPTAAALLRVLPRASLESLQLGCADTTKASHVLSQIRDSNSFAAVHNMTTFFELLERFTALRSLDISGNSLVEVAAELPACMAAPFMFLTGLTCLDLASTSMSAHGITHIIKTIAQRAARRPEKALQSLNISGNIFRVGGGMASLWQQMQGLTALTRLDAAECRMKAADIATVSVAVRNMPRLARLDLSHNWMCVAGMRRVFDALVEAGGKAARASGRSTGGLTCLALREGPMAALGPRLLASVAPPLRQLRALRRLDLSGHSMGVPGATTLCGCFGALRVLGELLVEQNDLKNEGALVLRDGVLRVRESGGLPELSALWLGGNGVSEEVADMVASALCGVHVRV